VFRDPHDFREESDALYGLLAPLPAAEFRRRTSFKQWTIDDIVRHLHLWNQAADESAFDPEAFARRRTTLRADLARRVRLSDIEARWHDGAAGPALVVAWRTTVADMADRWAAEDPKRRLAWVGPDMSLRSSITARLMETWAHGQAVYDVLGVARADTDRIRGIAVLGVNTFRWTFTNRDLEPPADVPHVRLTAPSGALWTWHEPSDASLVEGSATEFCQTVTQVRNVADTTLRVVGAAANRWMAIAQCFAGPAENPPAPGTRCRAGAAPRG
jgi:uncharacterized protein (TIGR03084 family)